MSEAIDYSITWKYICEQMDDVYGIPPGSEESFSMNELQAYVDEIWQQYIRKCNRDDWIKRYCKWHCTHCEYYEGVHDVQGYAPCEKLNKMVIWDGQCEHYSSITKQG